MINVDDFNNENDLRREIDFWVDVFNTAKSNNNYSLSIESVDNIILLSEKLFTIKDNVSSSDIKGLNVLKKLRVKLYNKYKNYIDK